MRVTQIFISDIKQELSGDLLANTATVQSKFGHCEYTLFDQKMIKDFLSDHYPGEVSWAFRTLKPYAYKADLARYAILNILGGWYVDLGFTWLRRINFGDDVQLLAFRDRQDICSSSWAAYNGVIYAKKGHPALQVAIDMIVENCKKKYYGVTPLCPTGPNLWGSAIARTVKLESVILGDFCELTPNRFYKNGAIVMPDGKIAAFYKPNLPGDPGRLTNLVPTGVNDYNLYWQSRTVYGES